ncbi:MAG: hypothetical protein HY841_02825 [Bacteroidetes bacterium]|nr:hypothetical protein [Bacteroidota bacterium]
MKKLILSSVMLFGMFAISAAPAAKVQCGVSDDQIAYYLQTCSHHHTVYWVRDIVGTCNSAAGIELGTATVYVSNGVIVSHADPKSPN